MPNQNKIQTNQNLNSNITGGNNPFVNEVDSLTLDLLETEKQLVYPPNIAESEKVLWNNLFETIRMGVSCQYFDPFDVNDLLRNYYNLVEEEKTNYILETNKKIYDFQIKSKSIINLIDNLEIKKDIDKVSAKYPPQVKPIIEMLIYSYISGTKIDDKEWETVKIALSPEGIDYFNSLNLADTYQRIQRSPFKATDLEKNRFNQPLSVEQLTNLIETGRKQNNGDFSNLKTYPEQQIITPKKPRSQTIPNLNNPNPNTPTYSSRPPAQNYSSTSRYQVPQPQNQIPSPRFIDRSFAQPRKPIISTNPQTSSLPIPTNNTPNQKNNRNRPLEDLL